MPGYLSSTSGAAWGLFVGVILIALAGTSHAAPGPGSSSFFMPDKVEPIPDELKNVTVTEHRGELLPLDLPFQDETGQPTKLRNYFGGRKPVILQLGYYNCPMLCGIISRGLSDSLRQTTLTVSRDYEVVFISIDPQETPALAAQKKQSYLQDYNRPGTAAGWHFLVGEQESIAKLSTAAGWQYKWVNSVKQYSHPAAIMICSPDGRISRYLQYGIQFDPKTIRLSLVEASDGKVGSAMDQLFLTCFQYDGHQGKYAFAALGIMRLGGLLTMGAVAVFIVRLLRRESQAQAATA